MKYKTMRESNLTNRFFFILLATTFFLACKSGPFNLIKPASPHEQYQRKLESAGLQKTAMGAAWINNAQQSLQKALTIKLPYKEDGYFSAEKIEAVAFKFAATRGEKLQIALAKKPLAGFMVYLDFWEINDNQSLKLLKSLDTVGNNIQYEIEKTGYYLIRLQPELLGGGEFSLTLTAGPSLAYPLKTVGKNQIQSFWGVDRDGGARRHEGIDIFSPFRTPVLAIAPGTVTGVNINNLGGKVVWLRPEGKNYTLYYAHLDEQTVTQGQTVNIGDTLGRMGNTGNAAGGPPHLHFGIYTNSGAVDPFPFVNPTPQIAPKVLASKVALNSTMRTAVRTVLVASLFNRKADAINLPKGTAVKVSAAYGKEYRVELPNGNIGYVDDKSLISITKPLDKYNSKVVQPVFDKPNGSAAVKFSLQSNDVVNVLASFEGFSLIEQNEQTGWIKTK